MTRASVQLSPVMTLLLLNDSDAPEPFTNSETVFFSAYFLELNEEYPRSTLCLKTRSTYNISCTVSTFYVTEAQFSSRRTFPTGHTKKEKK